MTSFHNLPKLLSITGAALLLASSAFAYSSEDFENALGNLTNQAEKLAAQSSNRCSADYKKLYSGKTLKIGLFYGYEDYDALTADTLHARSMAKMLTRPCRGTLGACGFKSIEHSNNVDRLTKVVNGKQVVISVYSTSLTDDNFHNTDPNSGYWDQDKQSRKVKDEFNSELKTSDVVFYSGHSRHGSGFGFDSQSLAQHAFNYIFKGPLQSTMEALAERPTRLKLLAVMSCTSDQFYRQPIEQANPNLSLVLTRTDVEADDGEQISLGVLNSILTQKCQREYTDAVRAENSPHDDVITFVNK